MKQTFTNCLAKSGFFYAPNYSHQLHSFASQFQEMPTYLDLNDRRDTTTATITNSVLVVTVSAIPSIASSIVFDHSSAPQPSSVTPIGIPASSASKSLSVTATAIPVSSASRQELMCGLVSLLMTAVFVMSYPGVIYCAAIFVFLFVLYIMAV